MKTMTRRHVPGDNLIKAVRKLGLRCGLSGPALVNVLLFSWFLASCGTVSKQSPPPTGGTPDFGLSASPGSLSIAQGSNGSSSITVAPQNGFTGNVTLAASGLPNGVTASFSMNPTTPTSTMSTLTLMASSTAATGMSTVTITGTSGALSHTTTLALTVSGTPDFTLSASPSSLTIAQGSNGSSTITVAPQNGFTGNVTLAASGLPNGVTASLSTNPSTPTNTMSTLTLTASSTATTGMSTVTITGTSGTLSHTTTLALTVNAAGGTPDFSLSASPSSLTIAQGSNGSSTITVTPQNGFNGNVTLAASGLPNSVTASFSANPTTPTNTMSTLTLTAGSTAATGMSTVTITGTSGTLSHTTMLALTVNTTVSTLTVTPTMLSFNYQIGSAVPGAQSVSVTASPSALSFTASTSGGTWLSAAPMNGTTPGTVSVTVNPAGLAGGTYNGNVTIASPGATGSPQTVQVTLMVTGTNHYEYVFTDGTLYVYDLDSAGFPVVKSKSIPTSTGTRGAVACAGNDTLYVSFGGDGGSSGNGGLFAYDLVSDTVVWTQNYSHGIDSHAITPDCALIYMPDGELANSTTWHVVDAKTGNEIGTIAGSRASNPHNTIVFNGHVYLGGRQSTLFQAANVSNNTVYFTSANTANTIRPFTINAEETAAYITETSFLGFEQIDLTTATGAVRFKVPVAGFSSNCSPSNCPSTPSHGISMSPDERWLYVMDSINGYVHVFDIRGGVTVQPVQTFDVKLNHGLLNTESPCAYDCLGDGWLHHSFDGRYVFVGDSGDVIDTGVQSGYANPPAVVGFLPQMANSRKEIEIDFQNGKVIAAMTNRSSIGTGAK
jgi:hypothetical protein